MNAVRVVNATHGPVVAAQVGVADRFWSRLRGLIARPPLEGGEGLLLCPCKGVHMYGVTYPIDVAFLDGDRRVVALYRELAPGARTRWHGAARFALELPAGTLAATGTELGDVLEWRAVEPGRNGRGPRGRRAAR